jgi:integrase
VTGYLAKYTTKSSEATGLQLRRVDDLIIDVHADPATHVGRLLRACWDLSAEEGWYRLRRWAQRSGTIRLVSSRSGRGRVIIWAANNLVFCTEYGTPIDPRNIDRSFRSLLIRARFRVDIAEDDMGRKTFTSTVRLHDLRHSCASFLLASGASPRVVMEILGHSGIAITMNTYAHALPSLLGGAAEGMDDVLE